MYVHVHVCLEKWIVKVTVPDTNEVLRPWWLAPFRFWVSQMAVARG